MERAAMEAILSKPVDGMEILHAQFAAASVIERDHTGVGFYTTISVPSSVAPVEHRQELHDALFDGAAGQARSDPGGWVFFHLWLDDGYLSCLEGYTIRDSWPNEDDLVEIQACRTMRDAKWTGLVEHDLVPGSDSVFESRWQDTTVGILLRIAILALIVVLAAMAVLTSINVL